MKSMTYGADPEFFLTDSSGPLPVCGWLGGTKTEHVALAHGCEIHEDGCAAEVTFPPQSSIADLLSMARHAVNLGVDYARGKRRDAMLHTACHVTIPHAKMQELGEIASTFGCSPEYDSYNGGASAPTVIAEALNTREGAMRFAGGHIHLGYRAVRPEIDEYVVAMLCDATVGLGLVASGEKQGKRRSLYGSPGRFRPTSYGMEYRVPSNGWLFNARLGAAVETGLLRLNDLLAMSPTAIRARWNTLDWVAIRDSITSENSRDAQQLLAA